MELTEEVKAFLLNTAKDLKGSARRVFMARTVQMLGEGGQRLAERELGWNRGTIRKGTHELESGFECVDAFGSRGRKRAEEHLPNLLVDLKAIVDSQSQADPQFRSNRLYTRLTAAEVRRQLIEKFGYSDSVELVTTSYQKGVKLTEEAWQALEPRGYRACLAWRSGLSIFFLPRVGSRRNPPIRLLSS